MNYKGHVMSNSVLMCCELQQIAIRRKHGTHLGRLTEAEAVVGPYASHQKGKRAPVEDIACRRGFWTRLNWGSMLRTDPSIDE